VFRIGISMWNTNRQVHGKNAGNHSRFAPLKQGRVGALRRPGHRGAMTLPATVHGEVVTERFSPTWLLFRDAEAVEGVGCARFVGPSLPGTMSAGGVDGFPIEEVGGA